MIPAQLLQVLFEGFEELQFFQIAVVDAANEAEAVEVLRAFLAKRNTRFVELDSEETRPVDGTETPPAWTKNGVPAERVVALSGRIWVKPEDN